MSEHVTDRRLTTQAILDEEAALLAWARRNAGVARTAAWESAQAGAARAVAATHRLVLMVGPAGTGKTTMLRSAIAQLRAQGRPAVSGVQRNTTSIVGRVDVGGRCGLGTRLIDEERARIATVACICPLFAFGHPWQWDPATGSG